MEKFWESSHCHYYDASSDHPVDTLKETFLAPPTGRVGGKGRSEPASEVSGGRMEGVELECQNG